MHRVLLRQVIIDVDSGSYSATTDFWAAALAATTRVNPEAGEFTELDRPAALPWVAVQDTGTDGPTRLHLDIETDDIPAEVARLTGLGATVLREDLRGFTVVSDPTGLVFCVVPPDSAEFATRSKQVG